MKRLILALVIFILFVASFATIKYISNNGFVDDTANLPPQSESQIVEKYIRENIKNIAPNDPVLGGNWYLVELNINTDSKSGEIIYEDGHIQSKASFEYSINDQNITLNNIREVK